MMLRISVNSVESHIAIAGRLHVKVTVEGLDDFRVHNSAHEEDGSYETTKQTPLFNIKNIKITHY